MLQVLRSGPVLTAPVRQPGSGTASALDLQVIDGPAALGRLEPEWHALMAAAAGKPTIYQSHEWAAACAARLRPGARLSLLTARNRGRLVAVAPLMTERRLGLATLTWLGGNLTIYGDVLAEANVNVAAWLERAFVDAAARGEAQSLALGNVRADARVAPFLEKAAARTVSHAAPWIDLRSLGSFEAWQARQSRSTRRSRSRRMKQLEAIGAVSFTFERAGPDTDRRIAELFTMKQAWARARGVISRTIGDQEFEAVVTAVASSGGLSGARLSVLSLDGRAIAIELGFVSGGVYASYLGAYDPQFEAYSPGALQLEKTLEACFAEGLQAFDLQPPADAYKQSLATGEIPVTSYAMALTSFGVIQRTIAAVAPVHRVKDAINRVPVRYRRLMQPVLQSMRQLSRPAEDGGSPIVLRLKSMLLLLGAGVAAAAIALD